MLHPVKSFHVALIGGFVALGAAAMMFAQGSPARAAPHPLVAIELFQSQGCSSCPPAADDLNAIAERSDVLALSFGVTYWDRLGWKDTFGSPQFTARQIEYARAGRGEVATPEFIINGTYAVVGADRRALDAAIAKAGASSAGPAIAGTRSQVHIAPAQTGAPATVWLVRYDPRTLQVPVRAGENSGRTLPHRNVVRELVKLGEWTGSGATFALPAARDTALADAVLVQRGNGGPIVAVHKL